MPGDWWNQGSLTQTIAASTDRYVPVAHSPRIVLGTTEAPAEHATSDAVTHEYLLVKQVSGTRTAMVAALRKNSADTALIITMNGVSGFFITAGGTTVASASGDLWSVRLNGGSGGAANMGIAQIALVTSHASKFYQPLATRGPVGGYGGAASYLWLGGQMTSTQTTVESTAQGKLPMAATLERIQVIVTVNTRTVDTSVFFRDDGVDSSSAPTIPASTTGSFEVASLSDSVAAGSMVNARYASPAGSGSVTIGAVRVMLATADRGSITLATSASNGGSQVPGTPRYAPIVGDNALASVMDSQRALRLRRSGRIIGIGVRVVSVTGSGTTWTVEVYRATGTVATGIVATLSANTSGWFDAAPTPVTVDPDEDYTIVYTRTVGAGTLFVGMTSVVTDEPAGGTTFTKTVTGTLSFAGALTRQLAAKRTLAGSLSVASTLGRLKSSTRTVTGSLSFTSALGRLKAYRRTLTAQLRLQGVVRGQVSKRITGVLSMAGTVKKGLSKGLSGVLSMTSTLGRLKSLSKGLTGVLAFSGALTTRLGVGKLLAGTLRFQGAVSKLTTSRRTGVLSFQGALVRRLALTRTLTAVLSFTSALGRVKIAGGILKTITAVLSFGPSTLTRDYVDNPEPVAGPDPWIVRMRRRWGGK